tara:strand:+ start:1023 stop:1145 length:123 start_codon:yes stop_codon:yes gene_type:complete
MVPKQKIVITRIKNCPIEMPAKNKIITANRHNIKVVPRSG